MGYYVVVKFNSVSKFFILIYGVVFISVFATSGTLYQCEISNAMKQRIGK